MARVRMAESMDAKPTYESKDIMFNVRIEARRRAAMAMTAMKTAVQVPCTTEGDTRGQKHADTQLYLEAEDLKLQKAQVSRADLREMALRATESPTKADPTVASSKTR